MISYVTQAQAKSVPCCSFHELSFQLPLQHTSGGRIRAVSATSAPLPNLKFDNVKPFRLFLRKTTKFNSFLHYRSKLANPCLKTTSTNWNVLLYSKLIDTVNFSSTNFLDYGDVWFGDSKSAADLTSTTACIFLLQITLQYSLLNYRSESDKYILFVWTTLSTATSLPGFPAPAGLPSSLYPISLLLE